MGKYGILSMYMRERWRNHLWRLQEEIAHIVKGNYLTITREAGGMKVPSGPALNVRKSTLIRGIMKLSSMGFDRMYYR